MQKIKKIFCFALDIFTLSRPFSSKMPKDIVIIKMGGLGDLAISLGLISDYLKQNTNESFLLICDSRWRLVSECFLGTRAKVVGIEVQQFSTDLRYRKKIYNEFKLIDAKQIILPTISRSFWVEDALASHISAVEKISFADDCVNKSRVLNRLSNLFYDRLIPRKDEFEFYNLTNFFITLGLKDSHYLLPHVEGFKIDLPMGIQGPYVLLSLGAGSSKRAWNVAKFCEVSRNLPSSQQIVFSGFCDEAGINEIEKLSMERKVINLANKTSVMDLVALVSHSTLVIANESGPIHLSVALGKKFICLSNGNHYKRFHPYQGTRGIYLYPDGFLKKFKRDSVFRKEVAQEISWDVNSISTEKVLKILNAGVGDVS